MQLTQKDKAVQHQILRLMQKDIPLMPQESEHMQKVLELMLIHKLPIVKVAIPQLMVIVHMLKAIIVKQVL